MIEGRDGKLQKSAEGGVFVDDRGNWGGRGFSLPRSTGYTPTAPLGQEQEPTRRYRQSFDVSYLLCLQVLEVLRTIIARRMHLTYLTPNDVGDGATMSPASDVYIMSAALQPLHYKITT